MSVCMYVVRARPTQVRQERKSMRTSRKASRSTFESDSQSGFVRQGQKEESQSEGTGKPADTLKFNTSRRICIVLFCIIPAGVMHPDVGP